MVRVRSLSVLKEERKKRIFDMWLACSTQEEIAEAVSIPRSSVESQTAELTKLESFPKSSILAARYDDAGWSPPLYRERGYGTFEEYCQQRWGWSRDYGYKLIRSAEVIRAIGSVDNCLQLPSTESQARELVPLLRRAGTQATGS